jgi:hypothetical protein
MPRNKSAFPRRPCRSLGNPIFETQCEDRHDEVEYSSQNKRYGQDLCRPLATQELLPATDLMRALKAVFTER